MRRGSACVAGLNLHRKNDLSAASSTRRGIAAWPPLQPPVWSTVVVSKPVGPAFRAVQIAAEARSTNPPSSASGTFSPAERRGGEGEWITSCARAWHSRKADSLARHGRKADSLARHSRKADSLAWHGRKADSLAWHSRKADSLAW